jgi:hypothetical protein
VPNTHDLNHKSVIPLIPQKFSLPCNMSWFMTSYVFVK